VLLRHSGVSLGMPACLPCLLSLQHATGEAPARTKGGVMPGAPNPSLAGLRGWSVSMDAVRRWEQEHLEGAVAGHRARAHGE
jgi:hypothetical protein